MTMIHDITIHETSETLVDEAVSAEPQYANGLAWRDDVTLLMAKLCIFDQRLQG